MESYDYIETQIIEPLNKVLDGTWANTSLEFWLRKKKCLAHCYEEGWEYCLSEQLEPFYRRFIYADTNLIDSKKYSLLDFIEFAIKKDWNFGYWCNMENIETIVENWANYSKTTGKGHGMFLFLMECMIAKGTDIDWWLWEAEMEEIFLKEEVEGNQDSTAIYCIFHAFVMIGQQEMELNDKARLYGLFREHWDFFRFLYSVMLKRVIGCRFTNFASVGNNLKSTSSYHPYLHLFYSAMMENKDEICKRGTKLEKMEKSLVDIREIVGSTPRSHELDELCQILFPDRFKEYLETHRLKSYRELEDELVSMQTKMQELINKQVEMLSDSAIPVEVIASELDKLSNSVPGMAYEVFEKLNSLLIANEVWTKNAPGIRNRILDKMQKPNVQATNYYAQGSIHNDDSKHISLTNNKKQIGQA